jgi:hypothetical protein
MMAFDPSQLATTMPRGAWSIGQWEFFPTHPTLLLLHLVSVHRLQGTDNMVEAIKAFDDRSRTFLSSSFRLPLLI